MFCKILGDSFVKEGRCVNFKKVCFGRIRKLLSEWEYFVCPVIKLKFLVGQFKGLLNHFSTSESAFFLLSRYEISTSLVSL